MIVVIFRITLDFVRFNITGQSIYETMIAREAAQFKENYTVKAYIVENDGGSTIYVYIRSALTNRYRRYIRFENEGNAILNGGVITVIGARNDFTFNNGSHYYVTMSDDTFWFQESTGNYTLHIRMIRRHHFSFSLFSITISFLLSMTMFIYKMFDWKTKGDSELMS